MRSKGVLIFLLFSITQSNNIRQLNLATAVSNVVYTKNCGTTMEDFELLITFLPESSTPNDEHSWITFSFNGKFADFLYCDIDNNIKKCYIIPEKGFPGRGLLVIKQINSSRGFGENKKKTQMYYKYNNNDFFCYNNFCLDDNKVFNITKENKDNFEFVILIKGTIDEDIELKINNKVIPCEIINNSLKCKLIPGIIDEKISSTYNIYTTQCGRYYKTSIQFVFNSSYYNKPIVTIMLLLLIAYLY